MCRCVEARKRTLFDESVIMQEILCIFDDISHQTAMYVFFLRFSSLYSLVFDDISHQTAMYVFFLRFSSLYSLVFDDISHQIFLIIPGMYVFFLYSPLSSARVDILKSGVYAFCFR